MEKASVVKHSHRIKRGDKYRGNPLNFIHNWDPKNKQQSKENVVHDSFDRRSIRHGVYVHSKVLHQLMEIIVTGKPRLIHKSSCPKFT